ncbi:RING-H2 finger protein ATL5 [Vanrija pseudolonga]|uniref:RING-H2 finger protein ATL5 n=1 Tax=Vanrija pseudolonga TaxID=143232 RepID=A0AAF0Y267_9TREE|nr:RING-H2 finger protein ATL5 [Vanrija pseudolonga]
MNEDGRGHHRERTRKKAKARDGPVPEPYLALAPRPLLATPPAPDPVTANLILPSTYVRRTRPSSAGPSSNAHAPSPNWPAQQYAAGLLAPPAIMPRRQGGAAAPTPPPQQQQQRGGYAANWASPPAIMPGGSAASSSMQTGRSVARPGIPGERAQRRRGGRVVNQEGSSLARRLTVTSREEGRAIGLSRGASMRRVNLWDDLPETDEAPPPFPFPTASNTRLPPTFGGSQAGDLPEIGEEGSAPVPPRSPPPRFDDLFPRRHSTGEALAPQRPTLRLTHSDVAVAESETATQVFVSAPSSPISEPSTAHGDYDDSDERDDRRMWNADLSAGYSLEERVRREAVRQAARAKALASGASHHVAQMVAQAATPLPRAAESSGAAAEAARAEVARAEAARAEAARLQAARAEAARVEAARIEAARAEAARAEAAREEEERAEAAREAAKAEAARVAAEAARAEVVRLDRIRAEAQEALASKAEAKRARAAQSEARRRAEKTEAEHRKLMAEAATRRFQAELAATRRAEAQEASRRRDIEAAVRHIIGSARVPESDVDAACNAAFQALKGKTPTADELVAAAKEAVETRIPSRTPRASLDEGRRQSMGEPMPRPGSANGPPPQRSTPSPVNSATARARSTPSPFDSAHSDRVASPRPPSAQSRASADSNPRRASRIQLIQGNLVEVPLDLSPPSSRDRTPPPNPTAGTIPWPQPYSPPSRPRQSTSDSGRRRSDVSEAENITQTPITSSPRSSFSIPTETVEPLPAASQFKERSGSGGQRRPGNGRSTSASTIDTIPEHIVFPMANVAPIAENVNAPAPAPATSREDKRLSRGNAVRRSSASQLPSPGANPRRTSLPPSKPDLPPLFTTPGLFTEEAPEGGTRVSPPRPTVQRSKTADEVEHAEAPPPMPHRHSIDSTAPSPATSNGVSAADLRKPLPSLPPGREAALRRRELGAPIELEDTDSPPPISQPAETPPLAGPLLDLKTAAPAVPPKSPEFADLGLTASELLDLLEGDAPAAESSAQASARAAARQMFESQLEQQSAIEAQVELDRQHALALETETEPEIEKVIEKLDFPPLPTPKRPPVPPRPRISIQSDSEPPRLVAFTPTTPLNPVSPLVFPTPRTSLNSTSAPQQIANPSPFNSSASPRRQPPPVPPKSSGSIRRPPPPPPPPRAAASTPVTATTTNTTATPETPPDLLRVRPQLMQVASFSSSTSSLSDVPDSRAPSPVQSVQSVTSQPGRPRGPRGPRPAPPPVPPRPWASRRPPPPPPPPRQSQAPPEVPPPPARLATRPARPLSDIGMPTPAVDTTPEIPRPQSSVDVHHSVSDDEDDEADEPEFEYTDLDLFASRLEGTGQEYEGLTHLTQFMGPATDPGASAVALDTLIRAPVAIDSKRTNAKGKVKLKMSVLGARVTTCPICLAQFRGGDAAVCLPRCGHVSHETCATRWFKESSNCMICRLPLIEETLI